LTKLISKQNIFKNKILENLFFTEDRIENRPVPRIRPRSSIVYQSIEKEEKMIRLQPS